ncbi:hypothetical protein OEZ85_007725 [Tetradesmus obliquus]|uniref:VHS domain-containing protein n=1 Tax=Tetradesmus obliquus TaxID=3088 RepID=A0ABY8TIK5_TETOB|nr:hypothetical protein OEZ85_007725 [Tetradesmus obliquus]
MSDHEGDENVRPEKRQRLDEQQAAAQQQQQQQQQQQAADADDAPPAPPPAHDQISAALTKIRHHIGNSSKFSKASQLLRQLLDAVDKAHRNELFATIKAAFANPEHCIDQLLRKDYVRLAKALSLRAEGVLSRQQRAQLQVYCTWALLRNELFTDDSFAYNKVVGKIKAAVAALADADEEQEAAWNVLHGLAEQPSSEKPKQQQQQQPAAAVQDEAEADPFGLNDFIAQAEAQAAEAEAAAAAAAAADAPSAEEQPPQQQQQEGAPWDAATMEVMRKQALLDCLVAAKEHQHKLAWARTSVELLIETVAKPGAQGGFADKFVPSQRQQLADLLRFVHAERAARKSGVNRRPGGKGTGEYQTSFEKARAEWSGASWVSARGKVGSAGDAKSSAWLG